MQHADIIVPRYAGGGEGGTSMRIILRVPIRQTCRPPGPHHAACRHYRSTVCLGWGGVGWGGAGRGGAGRGGAVRCGHCGAGRVHQNENHFKPAYDRYPWYQLPLTCSMQTSSSAVCLVMVGGGGGGTGTRIRYRAIVVQLYAGRGGGGWSIYCFKKIQLNP